MDLKSEIRDRRSGEGPGPPVPGLRPRPDASLVVYYDETCGPCTRTARLLDHLNWLGRVRFRPAAEHPTLHGEQYQDIQSLRRDGRGWAGFATYRQIAWRVPLLWPIAPFLYLWPVTRLGRRLYRRIADARRCAVDPSAREAPFSERAMVDPDHAINECVEDDNAATADVTLDCGPRG